jgi:hypothetical protein
MWIVASSRLTQLTLLSAEAKQDKHVGSDPSGPHASLRGLETFRAGGRPARSALGGIDCPERARNALFLLCGRERSGRMW